jgi:hypothetical protein
MGQGADFSLTAEGVDFVEEHTGAKDLLMRLLGPAGNAAADDPAWATSSGPVHATVQ